MQEIRRYFKAKHYYQNKARYTSYQDHELEKLVKRCEKFKTQWIRRFVSLALQEFGCISKMLRRKWRQRKQRKNS